MPLLIIGNPSHLLISSSCSFSSYGGLTFGDQIEDDYFNRSHALVWFNNKGTGIFFI